VRRSRKV
ncbi:hypothetical protein PGANDO_1621, partial [Porphyromonas gingivalis]